jgi:hypothetical protein
VVREKLATGGVFGIKAGDVGSQNLLGFKAAGFWPGNRQLGGDTHQATIVLIDPATGRPSASLTATPSPRHAPAPPAASACNNWPGPTARASASLAPASRLAFSSNLPCA